MLGRNKSGFFIDEREIPFLGKETVCHSCVPSTVGTEEKFCFGDTGGGASELLVDTSFFE